jgi:hypothetical protein
MLRYLLWAALGSGAGYYVAKKHLEADYESRLQEELEQTRKYYKNLYDEKLRRETAKVKEQAGIFKEAVTELTDSQEEEFRAALERILSDKPEWNPEWETSLKGATTEDKPEWTSVQEALKDDVAFADAVTADEPEEEEMPEEAAAALVNYQGVSATSAEPVGNISRVLQQTAEVEEKLTYVKPDGPRIIDFKKYAENGGDYEQHTVVYYAVDKEVSDESDEKLDEKFVGTHISYANLAKLNDQNTTIYVRDDKHRMDHEVIWSAGSFAVDVLGQQPE